MAKLKVTKQNGDEREYEITHTIQYLFEERYGIGFHKALIEEQKQTHVYYCVWEAMKRGGETVVPFGADFIDTIKDVVVLQSDPLD